MKESWRTVTLGEVVELRRGFDLPSPERTPGPYPVLSAGGVMGYHDRYQVDGAGFAIGRATNLGHPTWSDDPFWPLNTTLYAADFKGNWPRFLFHLFEVLDLTGFDSGSVQPMLNRNYIADLPVALPPLEEQKAISLVLDALEGKMACNGRVVHQAVGLLGVSCRGTSEHVVKLADIVRLRKSSVAPSKSAVVAHFSLPAFDSSGLPERVAGREVLSNKQILDSPCVLLSKLNPRIPRVWDVPVVPIEPAMASTEFLVLEPLRIPTGVLWGLLSQPEVERELEGLARGTTGSHQRVKPDDAMKLSVLDPATLGDQAIGLVDALSKRIWQAKIESRTLAALRDTLLPALMSGRLSVREAEDMVSEVV